MNKTGRVKPKKTMSFDFGVDGYTAVVFIIDEKQDWEYCTDDNNTVILSCCDNPNALTICLPIEEAKKYFDFDVTSSDDKEYILASDNNDIIKFFATFVEAHDAMCELVGECRGLSAEVVKEYYLKGKHSFNRINIFRNEAFVVDKETNNLVHFKIYKAM